MIKKGKYNKKENPSNDVPEHNNNMNEWYSLVEA